MSTSAQLVGGPSALDMSHFLNRPYCSGVAGSVDLCLISGEPLQCRGVHLPWVCLTFSIDHTVQV